MNNLYLLESDNYLLLDNKVREILDEKHLNINQLITYDLEECNITDAIIELDTYSLFNEIKVVYCKNAIFLTSAKSEINHNIDLFIKYLNNPSPNNILIISCNKTDSKKNIVKLLKEKAKCLKVEIDLISYIKERSNGYKISKDTINYLIDNTGQDIVRLTNELDKLMMLCDNKEITIKDIDLVVIKKIDNNIFDLIDAIISKNKKKSLSVYNNMVSYGEDIFKIFVFLANQIRLMYQVKVLRHLSNEEIANRLNVKNPKQIMAIKYKVDNYHESDLLNYLYELSIMDEKMKTGKCIDKIAFPIFIASLR